MKYAQRDALVSGLRELADFIEARGVELPISYPDFSMNHYVYPEYSGGEEVQGSALKKIASAAKAMAPCEKTYGEHYFKIIKKFGIVNLGFSTSRGGICTSRVVGQKEIPEQIIPARTEDILEWDCAPSLLEVL